MYKKIRFCETAKPEIQNKINHSIVLNYVRRSSVRSRAQIARDLNISAPTVSKIIDNLLKSKFLIEVGKDESVSGKRATRIKFNSGYGDIVCLDLSKDEIIIAHCDFEGRTIKKENGFKIFYEDPKLLEKVINQINIFINKLKSNKDYVIDIKALSISLPADVDIDSGRLSAPLFKNWNNLNLKEVLLKKFNIPVYLENSKNISIIGEQHLGIGKKYKDYILIQISEGVGAGIIINNQLVRGSTFNAGEVGFFVKSRKDLYKKHNFKGFIEEMVSPRNLSLKVIESIQRGKKTIINDIVNGELDKIDSLVVCRAAMLGDKLSNDIIKEQVEHIAIIVCNMVLSINPQVVIIAGDILGLPDVDTLYLKPLKEIMHNTIPFDIPDILKSSLGIYDGIIGCSAFAIDNILTKKFPYMI